MIDLFGKERERPAKPIDKTKRNWTNRFQTWCDKEAQDEYSGTGICGYSKICDYCADSSAKQPCAKALRTMLRETKLIIDFEKADYEDVWDGEYWRCDDEQIH